MIILRIFSLFKKENLLRVKPPYFTASMFLKGAADLSECCNFICKTCVSEAHLQAVFLWSSLEGKCCRCRDSGVGLHVFQSVKMGHAEEASGLNSLMTF